MYADAAIGRGKTVVSMAYVWYNKSNNRPEA